MPQAGFSLEARKNILICLALSRLDAWVKIKFVFADGELERFHRSSVQIKYPPAATQQRYAWHSSFQFCLYPSFICLWGVLNGGKPFSARGGFCLHVLFWSCGPAFRVLQGKLLLFQQSFTVGQWKQYLGQRITTTRTAQLRQIYNPSDVLWDFQRRLHRCFLKSWEIQNTEGLLPLICPSDVFHVHFFPH